MEKWNIDSDEINEDNMTNPKYGLFFEKENSVRTFTATDTDGFSQFQNSLFERKNETTNIEYNPMDVFKNALRFQTVRTKPSTPPKVNPAKNLGFRFFMDEIRPLISNQNPNISFRDQTILIAQEWKNLSPEQQEMYVQRARITPVFPGNNQII